MKNLILLLIVILLPLVSSHDSARRSYLSRGSVILVEKESDQLVSPNGAFTCGFYCVGSNAYTFAIWFTNSVNKTKVWTANWNLIVSGNGSRLTFHKDGSVVLSAGDGTIVWSTNTTLSNANQMQLLNTGNLVVTDPNMKTLWQSFDNPTNTLLPGQAITRNIKLVSSKTCQSVSSGYYSLYFDYDDVLRMLYSGPEVSSTYWPNPDNDIWNNGRVTYNSSMFGILNDLGQVTASDGFSFEASDKGLGIMRRLTLDFDGNLRLYSLDNSSGTWIVTWVAFNQICFVHGLCGKNGICLQTQSRAICTCPPNYEVIDSSDWSKGCKLKFDMSCDEPNSHIFVQLPNSDFWAYDLNISYSISLHDCKKLCQKDCMCKAFRYYDNACYTKSMLFNGKSSPAVRSTMYLKVPKGAQVPTVSRVLAFYMPCRKDPPQLIMHHRETKWAYLYGFVAVFGLVGIVFATLGCYFTHIGAKNASLEEQAYALMGSQFRKYTFSDLKRATQNFMEVIGIGGSGTVYKGKLQDERAIAVKRLKDVIQGEEQFWAEVSIIGRIYHMNLVKLLGFCSEGSQRLLVSEYVENGSLDKHLFIGDTSEKVLGWKERFTIALGTARGLAYLHDECLEWVIHCDVKPENILLGSEFDPKIADFGLAKLSKRGALGWSISHVRGTRGYMAPEWASNLPITAKVDVFSYGIVLLEIVKGKRICEWAMEGEKESYKEMWQMMKMLNERHNIEIEESWVNYFVDPNLVNLFDIKQAEVMVEIALSCTEEDRNQRPSMNYVVEMLLAHDS